MLNATSPLNKETDWESIKAFCEQLNNEFEGPQLATRLLAHKIQSPQEWEAMQALTVLETCMKNCGKRFHSEVGKFRFLNELIKVVSPKYLGTRAPEPVKKKVLEIMYSWTVGLPNETKISDAYQMLKKQGIVKQDPVLPDDKPLPPPPPRPKNAIFEDEEKSKMLSRLLNSTHPEDLRAANKLIKEMVQEDQKRMEKVSKRVNAIQEVKESVSLLTQLLADYNQDGGSQNNEELIKDLYQRCEKMRPTLFRLASDTEDNDEALAEILQANDSLTQVINLYRQRVKGEEVNGDGAATPHTALLDLTGLDTSSPAAPSYPEAPIRPHGQPPLPQENSTYLIFILPPILLLQIIGHTVACALLKCLNGRLLRDKQQSQSKPTLRDLQHKSSTNPIPTSLSMMPPAPTAPADISLASVTIPLESIKPSSLLPVTVFDRHSLRVLFHFAHDSPPSRPDVLVVVISMLSSAPVPVTNIRFQAAVPKVMKVKLQPPSGTELPAFNPILPPAAITQVLLLANPSKEKVRLRYKLTFTLGEESHDETGDVEQFPPPDTWGNL
uniref:Golgi associated, gamma adaptin ear containing, ARF binding protein 1 n=1 Tax=Scleropages formosus TaxID=113540 RepID=A0A8C9WC64_SCLFO